MHNPVWMENMKQSSCIMANEYVKQATWYIASNNEAHNQKLLRQVSQTNGKAMAFDINTYKGCLSVVRHKKHWEVVDKS